jgi:hypothetical protein
MKIKIIGSLLFLLGVLQLYVFGVYDVLTTLTHYSDALSGEFLLLINFAVIAVSVVLFFWDIK